MEAIMASPWFTWVILPALIFVARICDVSIGTMRLIFVSKGNKTIAPVLGFFEVIIWLLAIGQIMQHLDNIMCYIAYGGGFAAGNYIGIYLEERMKIGTVMLRVFPKNDTTLLAENLRDKGFGVTTVDIMGKGGKNQMIFSVIDRKRITEVLNMVQHHNPNAFYTIEDIRAVREGYRTNQGKHQSSKIFIPFGRRKGK
ncbi:MAG: DUF2179 domain-containing protein [Bacteroidales bacterium]|nr:DUF2179 domain-containing protein [Bacteroidales bacterium]MDD2322066.1 DUF2179 domain-containing protein [Bacteroidales bacterium]MDD3009736.1 DUF2179 domain-containing protein [Bacteroidales bacterium]MDD3960669.1 DUF2179 domain-containing protein [Bacteroidales bacterium]MDY0284991.1 DUF2179 domain-containing protein [Bacteroidales bacterium]